VKDSVSATGYTSVILVMNMRRFIADADHERFERMRSSPVFRDILRHQWRDRLQGCGTFVAVGHDDDARQISQRHEHLEPSGSTMSTEEVGFLTGIFRQGALDQYSTPTYYLKNKAHVRFPDEISDNIQFKDLFDEPWRSWDIFIRPTINGMFLLRLRRAYTKPTPLLTIASDVLRLQMAFDLRSARQKLRYFEQQEALDPNNAALYRGKQRSIYHLLEWLGADNRDADTTRTDYVPVQWKLAMEVCRQLVRDVGTSIEIGRESIQLQNPEQRVSTPLHDSYVIYHIDELIAISSLLGRARHDGANGARARNHERSVGVAVKQAAARKSQPLKELVKIEDIHASQEIQNQLIGLIEGAVLKKVLPERESEHRDTAGQVFTERPTFFPSHHNAYLSNILGQNRVTWNDEICLIAPRAAIIMPSRQSRPHELFICNFSTTKERVMYTRYWEALERMLEFGIEIRVLAQLLERMSSDLLLDFEQETYHIRAGMLNQNVEMNSETLRGLTDRVANLGRMLGVGQTLGTPSTWSRAEFAIEKAQSLLQQQDVPQLFKHSERNVDSLNSLLYHIDEMYLADLSEKRNNLASLTSVLLAGFSLIIIFFTIPSFWADSKQLNDASVDPLYGQILQYLTPTGTFLALALMMIAILLIIYSVASFNGRFHRLAQRQINRHGRKRGRG